MDRIIYLDDELKDSMKLVNLDIGIIDFMNLFPLLKSGLGSIPTIETIFKIHNILNENKIEIKISDDILSETKFDFGIAEKGHEEDILAESLFEVVNICKYPDYIPQEFRMMKHKFDKIRDKYDLKVSILFICAGTILYNFPNNSYIKLIYILYQEYIVKYYNEYGHLQPSEINIRELLDHYNMFEQLVDLRRGNCMLYRFAELCEQYNVCNDIKNFIVNHNLLIKEYLTKNFEDLIGSSDIPINLYKRINELLI